MGFKKFDSSTWQPINPKKLKGIPYTGTLPATLTGTKAGYLHRYKIYGNTEQTGTPTPENPIAPSECGERTENLCDENNINQGYYAYADGKYFYSNAWVNTDYIAIKSNTEYTAKFGTIYGSSRWYGFVWYDKDKQYISTTSTQVNPSGCELTAKSPANASFCVFNIGSRSSATDIVRPSDIIYCMLNRGSTALPYEPYGYKLPLTSASQDVDIYIGDDTLSADEYVDSCTGKIYRMVGGVLTPVDPPVPFPQIPASAGSTTISWAGEGLAPSEFDSIQEWVDIPTYTYTNGAWVADN